MKQHELSAKSPRWILPLLTALAVLFAAGFVLLLALRDAPPERTLVLYEGPSSLRAATAEDLLAANEDQRDNALLRCSDTFVTVNGYDCFVYDTTVNNTHSWAANYLPKLSRTPVTYFDFEGWAEVEVRTDRAVEGGKVFSSLPVRSQRFDAETGTLRFIVTQPGFYTVEWDGSPDRAVHVFAGAPPQAFDGEENVLTIPPGEWNVGHIVLESGQTLYLSGGAVVHGTIYAENAEDIRVTGRGILDGSGEAGWRGTAARVPLDFQNCQNVTIEGVTLLNANAWSLNGYQLEGGTVSDVRILSARPNGDGITLQSCKDVSVRDSFVRSWDDSVVVKNYGHSSESLSFSGMTLWTDLAQSMEIGYETNKGNSEQPFIRDILFENIYVLHALHKPVISVHNADNAVIDGVTFRNIIVEDARVGLGDAGEDGRLIDLHITRSGSWSTTKERGWIRNVLMEQVTVQSAAGIPPSRIKGWDEEHRIENVSIRGLRINGKLISSAEEGRFTVDELTTSGIAIEGGEAE